MSDFELDLEHCLTVLSEGGTILYPTDTVWGIGCDATNEEAVSKIFEIKERPNSRSMIVLVADPKDILTYVAAPDPAVFDFIEKTTSPTTIIYPGALGLAPGVLAEDGSAAIRVVNEKFCNHLIKRFRKPIVSTSANISGDPAPKKFTDVLSYIREKVDYVVRYRQDDETEYEPSSIVKWNKDGSTILLR